MVFPCKNKLRWDVIKDSLLSKSKPIKSINALESAIKMYNPAVQSFVGLEETVNSMDTESQTVFFDESLPLIVNLAVQIENLKPIPLLKRNVNGTCDLTQRQIGCLIANGFLCTFEDTSNTSASKNLDSLFGCSEITAIEKIKCLLVYLSKISESNGKLLIVDCFVPI